MKKKLSDTLKELGKVSDYPLDLETAKKRNKKEYLELDYAPEYGGYRLVLVEVKTGTHSGCFGRSDMQARMRTALMQLWMEGIISGIRMRYSVK